MKNKDKGRNGKDGSDLADEVRLYTLIDSNSNSYYTVYSFKINTWITKNQDNKYNPSIILPSYTESNISIN